MSTTRSGGCGCRSSGSSAAVTTGDDAGGRPRRLRHRAVRAAHRPRRGDPDASARLTLPVLRPGLPRPRDTAPVPHQSADRPPRAGRRRPVGAGHSARAPGPAADSSSPNGSPALSRPAAVPTPWPGPCGPARPGARRPSVTTTTPVFCVPVRGVVAAVRSRGCQACSGAAARRLVSGLRSTAGLDPFMRAGPPLNGAGPEQCDSGADLARVKEMRPDGGHGVRAADAPPGADTASPTAPAPPAGCAWSTSAARRDRLWRPARLLPPVRHPLFSPVPHCD